MYDVSLQSLLRPSPLTFRLPPLATLAIAATLALFALTLIGLALSGTGLLLWMTACAALPLVLPARHAFGVAMLVGAAGSSLLGLLIGEVAAEMIVKLHIVAIVAVGLGLLLRRRWMLEQEAEQLRAGLAMRDAIGTGIWQLGGEGIELLDSDGRLLAASPAALALWQADNEATLRQYSWLERWGAGTRNPIRPAWLELQASGRTEFEGTARTFSGEERQLAVTLEALTLPNGTRVVLCRSRDQTDEHAQREVLAAKSGELEQLLDAIDEGFCAIDRNWCFRYLNRRGAVLLKCEREELIGQSIWQVAPEAYLHRLPEELRDAMERGKPCDMRIYHPRLRRWLQLRITPATDGITVLFRDVTADVETERERSEHLARLQVVQELTGVAGWQHNFGTGQLKLSMKALELLGLPRYGSSEHKRQLLQLLHPSDRRLLLEGLTSCAQSGSDQLLDITTRMPDVSASGGFRHLRWLARRAGSSDENDGLLVGAVQDVTAAVEARERWEFMRTVIEVLPSDVCVVNQSGATVAMNRLHARRDRHGERFAPSDIGDNLLQLLAHASGPDRDTLQQMHRKLSDLLAGRSDHFDFEYALHEEDELHWYSTRATLLHSDGQRFAVLSHDDITERRTHEERLYRAANFDQLTALPNRSALYQQLAQRCAGIEPFSLLLLDLDRFQGFNDSFGVHAADQLLRQVVTRLESQLPPQALFYRLGSDEFVALLPEGSQPQPIAELLLASLSSSFQLEQACVFVSASIGAAQYPHDGRDGDVLLSAAGAALAQVKSGGRNGYCRFQPGQRVATREQLQLETELHDALERSEFELFYQGKYRLAASGDGDALTGGEALLRWRSPTRGLVSPAAFIPLLEQSGLIVQVGDWVLRDACRQLAQWHRDSGVWLSVAINVSPLQLANSNFAATARAIRDAAGIPAGCVELEITESLLMRDIEHGAQLVHELREAGFRVALDDFGTGHSSLSYLRTLALDTLKIDRSFVSALDAVSGAEIIAGVVHIARALQMQVVAEGVETIEQRETLRRLGCDNVQGFLMSRPLPAAEFTALATPCGGQGCSESSRQNCRTAACSVWRPLQALH